MGESNLYYVVIRRNRKTEKKIIYDLRTILDFTTTSTTSFCFFNNLTIQPFNLSSLDSIIDINKNIYINRKWLYKHLNKEQLMLDLKKNTNQWGNQKGKYQN